MRLAVVFAELCATESPTILATGRKDSGNRLIGIPYRLAMIGQWARLEAVYAIDDFPDDDLLWRIEWIGGVGYNTSVPSDPLMDVCMAQPPAGETNPLSARFCTVANNVGDSATNLVLQRLPAQRTLQVLLGLLLRLTVRWCWPRHLLKNGGHARGVS